MTILRSVFALSLVGMAACRSTPSEPEGVKPEPAPLPASEKAPEPQTTATSAAAGVGVGAGSEPYASATPSVSGSAAKAPSSAPAVAIPRGHRKVVARPVAEARVSPDDPLAGKFTLADATKGLTGKGKLIAEIRTEAGKLTCELYEDRAPITVANFVGLARGLRPWKNPKGEWVKTPGYDGTTFHRVVKGFMIQGGDPAGTGAGEPGYVISDEIWEDAYHSERGLLCMANRGPNTNGMQFFIMDGSAPHLDIGYTIFGKCGPESVIEKIANTEVRGDRAVKPPKIEKVTIKREPAKK